MLTGAIGKRRLVPTRGLPWYLVAAMIASSLSCGSGRSAAATVELQRLAETYWEWRLQEFPRFATSIGDRRYNDRLSDLSLEAFEKRQVYRRELLQALEQVRRSRLAPSDRITYDLLHRELEAAIENFSLKSHLLAVSQLAGPHIDLPRMAARFPFETTSDYRAYLTRLEQVPGYLEQVTALLRAGMAAGVVMARNPMRQATYLLREQFEVRIKDNPFYYPFTSFPDVISTRERRDLSEQARRALDESILPAFQDFYLFIVNEYYPACRQDIGLASLPQGERRYGLLVEVYAGPGFNPGELNGQAQAEVERLELQIDSIRQSLGFIEDRTTFAWSLQNSPSLFHRSPRALLRNYRRLLDHLKPQLSGLFHRLPAADLKVVETPAHLAPRLAATAYQLIDSNTVGQFLVNTLYYKERPIWNMEAQALSDGLPGRHLRQALLNEMAGLQPFRRHVQVPAFTEGWALYAETLGPELGLYQSPHARYGWLTRRLLAAVRVVVDTGIHSQGWDRRQALDYLAEHTTLPAHRMSEEINRLSAAPGTALARWTGAVKIAQLQREAREKLGDGFDIRAFHDTVLGQGPLPLDLLEQAVKDYIKLQLKSS
jgi:uncharacterized protein (DUF885 family)